MRKMLVLICLCLCMMVAAALAEDMPSPTLESLYCVDTPLIEITLPDKKNLNLYEPFTILNADTIFDPPIWQKAILDDVICILCHEPVEQATFGFPTKFKQTDIVFCVFTYTLNDTYTTYTVLGDVRDDGRVTVDIDELPVQTPITFYILYLSE